MLRTFLRTIFLPIFLIGGVALALVVGPMEVVKARESRAWPMVTGSVTHTNIAESLGRKGREYRPVIRYRYQVDGRQYESDVLSRKGTASFAERKNALELLEGVSAGGAPVVHYNPDRPDQAMLFTESLIGAWAILTTGIVLLFACAWILLRLPAKNPQSGCSD